MNWNKVDQITAAAQLAQRDIKARWEPCMAMLKSIAALQLLKGIDPDLVTSRTKAVVEAIDLLMSDKP